MGDAGNRPGKSIPCTEQRKVRGPTAKKQHTDRGQGVLGYETHSDRAVREGHTAKVAPETRGRGESKPCRYLGEEQAEGTGSAGPLGQGCVWHVQGKRGASVPRAWGGWRQEKPQKRPGTQLPGVAAARARLPGSPGRKGLCSEGPGAQRGCPEEEQSDSHFDGVT